MPLRRTSRPSSRSRRALSRSSGVLAMCIFLSIWPSAFWSVLHWPPIFAPGGRSACHLAPISKPELPLAKWCFVTRTGMHRIAPATCPFPGTVDRLVFQPSVFRESICDATILFWSPHCTSTGKITIKRRELRCPAPVPCPVLEGPCSDHHWRSRPRVVPLVFVGAGIKWCLCNAWENG
jgi:hypothetical protein